MNTNDLTNKLLLKKLECELAIPDLEFQLCQTGKYGAFGQSQGDSIGRVELIQRSTRRFRSANNFEVVLAKTPEQLYQLAIENFQ